MSRGLGDRREPVRTVPPGVGFGNVLLLRFVAFFVRKWSRWIARVMRRGQRRRYPAGDDATRRTRQEEALFRRAMGNPCHREAIGRLRLGDTSGNRDSHRNGRGNHYWCHQCHPREALAPSSQTYFPKNWMPRDLPLRRTLLEVAAAIARPAHRRK